MFKSVSFLFLGVGQWAPLAPDSLCQTSRIYKLPFTRRKCLGIARGNKIATVHNLFWGTYLGIAVTFLALPRIH